MGKLSGKPVTPLYLKSSIDWGFSELLVVSVTSKKSPNVNKICPKMSSLEKCEILTLIQKLLNNVGDLGKLIVAKGFEKLPKVQ